MEHERRKPASLEALRIAPLAFTIPEVIGLTKIGRTSIYDDIAAGTLIARKRGSKTIILAEELAAYLAALPTVKVNG